MSLFPKPIKTPTSKPAWKQILEMINWGARLLVTPNDYASYRLYEKGKTKHDALRFLSGIRAKEIHAAVNHESQILENKLIYDNHYSHLGLPVPHSLAVITKQDMSSEHPLLNSKSEVIAFISNSLAHGQHLVIKEVSGMQGSGVLVIIDILQVEGREFFLYSNGSTDPIDETLESILESNGVWFIQERIKQHALLESFNPTSLNTLRLGTFKNNDGSVDIDYAALRIGRKTAQIDAFSLGGIVVPIDLRNGNFSRVGVQKPKYSLDDHCDHPDSKISFSEKVIPFWDEIIELAQKFALNAGDNKMIGWDIAITPEGPVFVEGNHNWDSQLAQAGTIGVINKKFITKLEREADLKWSATELPTLAPFRFIKILLAK